MGETKQADPDALALVRATKAGDRSAFEKLVTRHKRRIYALVRRITGSEEDAQDVTQQAILSTMQNLADVRASATVSIWLTTMNTWMAVAGFL